MSAQRADYSTRPRPHACCPSAKLYLRPRWCRRYGLWRWVLRTEAQNGKRADGREAWRTCCAIKVSCCPWCGHELPKGCASPQTERACIH